MDSVLLTGVMTVGSGVITYVLGHMAGRKKSNAETEEIEQKAQKIEADAEATRLKNIRDTIDIYKVVSDDLREELKQVSSECSQLRKEINTLRGENVSLKKEIHSLNLKLQNRLNEKH